MALSGEQYSIIKGILDERRHRAEREARSRQEEAYRRVPALTELDDEVFRLNHERVLNAIRGGTDSSELLSRLKELEDEKKALLSQAGISRDSFQPRYFCPKCRDTGYIDNKKCGCMKQLESGLINSASGLPEILSRETFRTLRTDVYDAAEPIRELMDAGMTATQYSYMRETVLPQIRRYVQEFGPGRTAGLFMTGPAGTGKTFLINCIARELIDRQYSVVYMTAGDMFDSLYRESFSREEGAQSGCSARINDAELLIIDDLGSEFATAFSVSRLFGIIAHRLSAGLSTIISSNLSLNQISSVYGERVASRIYGEYTIIPFYGKDIRMNRDRRKKSVGK